MSLLVLFSKPFHWFVQIMIITTALTGRLTENRGGKRHHLQRYLLFMMPKGWAACKCFYRRNFYVKQLDEHLEYLGDEQFLFQYQKYFNKCDGRTILEDVKTELARRKNRFFECEGNRKNILVRFQPSLEIRSAAATKIIERSQPTEIIDNIFRLPVFEPSFCDQIMEEIGKIF